MAQRTAVIFTHLSVLCCSAIFGAGCASTQLYLTADQQRADAGMATITFKRLGSMIGAAAPLCLMDSGTGIPYDTDKKIGFMTPRAKERRSLWQRDDVFDQHRLWMPFDALLIGEVGPGDSLTWRRPPGIMQLAWPFNSANQVGPCYRIEAGQTYVVEFNFVRGVISSAYSIGDPASSAKPMEQCAAPVRPSAVQTIDSLPHDKPKGYAEFYVAEDSALDLLPIGQVMTTNWIAQSTVYHGKKLRIACPPGRAAFVTYNMDNLQMSDEAAMERPHRTYDLGTLSFISMPNRIKPVLVEIREGMVTPVCARAVIKADDQTRSVYTVSLIPEAARPW